MANKYIPVNDMFAENHIRLFLRQAIAVKFGQLQGLPSVFREEISTFQVVFPPETLYQPITASF